MKTDFERRLSRLERGGKVNEAELLFPDGSVRALPVRDPLGLCLASFRRVHAQISGEPEPQSEFAHQLDLLGRCSAVRCEAEPLVGIAHDSLQQKGEMNQ